MHKKVKVLFVCHGNICRSPMAEFMLKDMVKGLNCDFLIESCATSFEEIGNDIHMGTKYELDLHNIPYEKRHARRYNLNDYDNFDYILCMDDLNIKNLNKIKIDNLNKYKKLRFYLDDKSISDPWYTGNFKQTYLDIYEGLEAFLKYLNINY